MAGQEIWVRENPILPAAHHMSAWRKVMELKTELLINDKRSERLPASQD
jgi:hypothetical protein